MQRFQCSIDQIINAVSGDWLYKSEQSTIHHLLIDSRKATPSEGTLFIAIKGERHDGHAYLKTVRENGIRNFLVSDEKMAYGLEDSNVILVENTLAAFQKLAAWHRTQLNVPVLAITGSNGKTVVKEWLYQLLKDDLQITRSPRSFNSQVGVPLSVWMLRSSDDLGIIEAGISLPGEMNRLQNIIQPTEGIFTNIGSAHSENFDDPMQKAMEKVVLFKDCNALVYCLDHKEIKAAVASLTHTKTFTWGRHDDADLKLIHKTPLDEGLQITASYEGENCEVTIPFTDQASIENAMHCWAYLLMKKHPMASIAAGLQRLTPVAMRLELLDGINNTSIVNDVYSLDLESLEIALDFLRQQKHHSRKSVVLSDIVQSGMEEAALYNEVAKLLKRYEVDRMVGIGPAISQYASLFTMEAAFYPNTKKFLKSTAVSSFRDETILLKGARQFSFENIARQMQQQAHETVMEINLEALRHNLNRYRNLLHHNTKIMAMVKAFSYGAGSYEIASLLEFNRVDYLAVAYTDEGIELRKAGISLPIMVMNPESNSYDAMLKYRLEPELYSFRVLTAFAKQVERQAMAVPYPVHLKIDTGMHRLGFTPEEIPEVIAFLNVHPGLEVRSVFSHLVSSEDADHDGFTQQQISTFNSCAAHFKRVFGDQVLAHILNSSGIVRFPEAHADMVRLGIGLYGIASNPNEQKQLQTVSTLKTVISQIKNIPAGETIGYGRKGKAEQNMTLATLPIGYADGLDRRLSNGVGKVWINGKAAKIIGNVCMDMVMVDITNMNANEGDAVLIFGPEHPVTEIADALGTIPYEVLTSVSRRVKRVYFTE